MADFPLYTSKRQVRETDRRALAELKIENVLLKSRSRPCVQVLIKVKFELIRSEEEKFKLERLCQKLRLTRSS